jgi:hypothetical protein
MSKVYEAIDDTLTAFLARQHMFFVATAPLAAEGLLNLSPKGGDTFRVLGPREVAYVDLTGSGVETIAHVRENGRIIFMFCAFEGPPKIVRLHGRGTVVLPDDPAYGTLAPAFPSNPGARAIVRAEIVRIADSCGYAVPLLDFRADRRQLDDWSEHKGPEGLAAYRGEKNARSLDGLPGIDPPGSGDGGRGN